MYVSCRWTFINVPILSFGLIQNKRHGEWLRIGLIVNPEDEVLRRIHRVKRL